MALLLSGLVCVVGLSVTCIATPTHAAGCLFEPQGEGHVTSVIDGRTFRLQDGREILLAGIEPVIEPVIESVSEPAIGPIPAEHSDHMSALANILNGHDVALRGPDDAPDRYGRQPAFVFLEGDTSSVQSLLLSQGDALVSATIGDRNCAATLMAAEAVARQAKAGFWADPAAIKRAESTDDLLAAKGRFTLVEGKVLSVRQAGATTYLNFGRNWTRDFAVTISRRIMSAFEAGGILVKSLENKRIRVRGWIELRGGPRIEVLRLGQIEVLD